MAETTQRNLNCCGTTAQERTLRSLKPALVMKDLCQRNVSSACIQINKSLDRGTSNYFTDLRVLLGKK